MLRLLEGQILTKISEIADLRNPAEAVGLILPNDEVVELPNRSLTPHNRFEVLGSDVKLTLDAHSIAAVQEQLENCTIWHSHPSGGLGPSTVDMRHRVSVMSHLVVTLDEDGSWVPSWY